MGNYEKQEYDILLKSGEIKTNCWPDAGKFHCLSNGTITMGFNVSQIRKSAKSSFDK